MELDAADFRRFCEIAYDKAGIALRPGKEMLVAARVSKRIRALGLSGPKEYLALLESPDAMDELTSFLDVISTNYTRFFREPVHFDMLRKVVADLVSTGQREFKIWCAASSTGEEPYSLAMTVLEAGGSRPVKLRMLATDISTRVLAEAKAGVYAESSLAEVPTPLRAKYFRKIGEKREAQYEVVPKLRGMIMFRRLNLAKPPYPMQGPVDFVFLRNVMIYFDRPVRQGLVSETERLLRPSGLLFVGHAETLGGVASGYVRVKPSVYQKPFEQRFSDDHSSRGGIVPFERRT